MKRELVEFIGTFFLMFTICLSVLGGSADIAPFVFGTTLVAFIYAGRHISGAHYNPAVTVALNIRGLVRFDEICGYVIAQVLAAVSAAFVAIMLLGGTLPVEQGYSVGSILISEFLGTFALVYIILLVATEEALDGNQYYGVAIGLVVIGCAFALGRFSGAAFNPAVAVGLAVSNLASWSQLWAYFLAELAGGVSAAVFYRYLKNDSAINLRPTVQT